MKRCTLLAPLVLIVLACATLTQATIYRDNFDDRTGPLRGGPHWVCVHGAFYGYQLQDDRAVSIYYPVVEPGMFNIDGFTGVVHQGQTYQRVSIDFMFPEVVNEGCSPEFYLNLNWDGTDVQKDGHGFDVMTKASGNVPCHTYRIGVRGIKEFSVMKLDDSGAEKITTGPNTYSDGLLSAKTWYRMTLEREGRKITGTIASLGGTVLGQGQIIDDGNVIDGGRVVLTTFYPPNTKVRSLELDNFEYELDNREQIKACRVGSDDKLVIDGKLSEEFWQKAAVTSNFGDRRVTAQLVQSAKAQVAYDDQNLYVSFQCPLKDAEAVKAAKKLKPDRMLAGNTVEVFLDPFLESRRKAGLTEDPDELFYNYRKARIFRFAVNAVNGRLSELMGRPWWQVPWRSATHISDDSWTAEIEIPFASLSFFEPAEQVLNAVEAGWTNQWAVNFACDDTSWVPDFDRSGYPLAFGKLADINVDLNPYRWGVAPSIGQQIVGDIHVWWHLGNWTGRDQDVKVIVRDIHCDKKSKPLFEPQHTNLKVPNNLYRDSGVHIPTKSPGEHRLLLSIIDQNSTQAYVHHPLLLENVKICSATWDRSFYMEESEARLTFKLSKYLDNEERIISSYLRKKGNEKVLQTRKVKWSSDKPTSVKFNLDTLANGEYITTVAVSGYENYPFEQALVKLPPRPGAVQYTDNGMILRDSKPFFPIGFYYITRHLESSLKDVNDSLMEEYVGSGFNTLSLEWRNAEGYIKTLKTLKKYGIVPTISISVMPEIFGLGADYRAKVVLEKRFPIAAAAVEMISRQAGDNILAWYTVDEGNQSTIPRVKGLHEIIHWVDPYHPSFTVTFMPYLLAHHSATDILGSDLYPGFPGGRLSVVADGLEVSASMGKPALAVLQTFGEPSGPGATLPTPTEIRCMSYISLVHNACGILYFSYDYNGPMREAHPLQWQELKKIASEIRELGPAVLAQTEGNLSAKQSNGTSQVHTRVIFHGDAAYFIAVNTLRRPINDVKWQATGLKNGDLEVMWENRKLKVQHGKFSDDFQPLAVHVYRQRIK